MKRLAKLGLAFLLSVAAGTAGASVRYVWRDNPGTPVPPYTNGWAEAATNIQDAVDAAADGDTVLVTNGVYNAGGRVAPGDSTLKTRLVITNAVTVVSVNGAEGTLIVGAPHAGAATGLGNNAVRCVYLQTNSVLSGFTVTNGFTLATSGTTAPYFGGGIRCEGVGALITNCVIVANSAGSRGGGVYNGTLYDCTVASNAVIGGTSSAGGGGVYGVSAWNSRIERNRASGTSNDGGGAYGGSLAGCTLAGNSAGRSGGGSYTPSVVTNCIIRSNTSVQHGGGIYYGNVTDTLIESNTVTGASYDGGGYFGASAASDMLTGCTVVGNSARYGGGVYSAALVSNCVIVGNSGITYGGGLYKGVVLDSWIASNRVTATTSYGGGYYGTVAAADRLVGCSVVANSAVTYGGGVYNAVLSNCMVRANRAVGSSTTTGSGGGYYVNTPTGYLVYRCVFLDNEANYQGGGAYQGKFYSCVFSGNRAAEGGGFYSGSTSYQLNSCSVLGNRAANQYGGVYSGTVKSSIVFGNEAVTSPNYSGSSMTYSCSDPLPSGTGNTNASPLVSGYADPHLLPGSPLIGKGLVEAWMTGAADIDGEARTAGAFTDMGADQQYAGGLTGPLGVTISATNACVPGYPHTFRAEAAGLVGGLVWDFGDGTRVTNVNPMTHTFAAVGSYTVRVTVTNASATAWAELALAAVDITNHVSRYGSHTAPFDTWEKAATNLQAAVDWALPGGRVLVSNGVYRLGGRPVAGQTVTNRVVLDKAVTVTSVGGAGETFIEGAPHAAGTPLGNGAVRGVYVGAEAVLEGFTVTNGCSRDLSSDVNGQGGGLYVLAGGRVAHCVITACQAVDGGGAHGTAGGLIEASTLGGNTARGSGGTSGTGGGVCGLTLRNCRITGNTALGTGSQGGGAYQGKFYSCVFSGNRAVNGGGFYGGSGFFLASCTVMGNTATTRGGGAYNASGKIGSSILYSNEAPSDPNVYSGTVTNSCADPLPSGAGNTNANPLVTGYADPHLLPGSPCLGTGKVEAWMTGASDIDGEARTAGALTDMGADQRYDGGLAGALSVAVSSVTNACVPGYPHTFRAEAAGLVGGLVWDFGDGVRVTNVNPVTHTFAAVGSYTVRVTVTNATATAWAELALAAVDITNHVSLYGSHTAPFDTWERAATNLQAAVDWALPGGRVLVSNGVYRLGGRPVAGQTVTNRVALDKAVTVTSVGGAGETFIEGAPHAPGTPLGNGAVRGVYVGAEAALEGFTVTNGCSRDLSSDVNGQGGGLYVLAGGRVARCVITACQAVDGGGAHGTAGGLIEASTLSGNTARGKGSTSGTGGGVCGLTLRNCRITGNTALGTASQGGGAYQGKFYSCVFSGNRAVNGGGFYGGSGFFLASCTVMGNTATTRGGGAYNASGKIGSSILYANTAPTDPNVYSGTVTNSCADPLPSGAGNTNASPLVTGYADPHLLPGSPCLGTGKVEAWMTGAADIDGEARMAGALTDMGADQRYDGGLEGALSVAVSSVTNACVPGYPHTFRAEAAGLVGGLVWDFGDGTLVTNVNPVTHTFAAVGSYTVRVTVTNATATATGEMTIGATDYTLYVALEGGHTPPFDTWVRAATNIQAAVDALALPGGRILVSNGVYRLAGRPAADGQTVTNRVALDKAVTVISVSGPALTLIEGAPHLPGTPLGNGAVRGVYVGAEATLAGFTVTNGFARNLTDVNGQGGGVFVLSGGRVTNCVITACQAVHGGGAHGTAGGVVEGSTLSGNTARGSGGTSGTGGGVCGLTLRNCRIEGNMTVGTAGQGGGAYGGEFTACRVVNNISTNGGGACQGKFYSCVFSGNRASNGGGFYGGTGHLLANCSVMDNTALVRGGGVYNASGKIGSSILYANTAPSDPNVYSGTVTNSCADPLPAGAGNTNVNPLVTGYADPHLLAGSPCLGTGKVEAWMAGATDIDGDARTSGARVDMGADQRSPASFEGPLTVSITAATNVCAAGWPHRFRAEAVGKVDGMVWDFGDGQKGGDVNPAEHAFAAPGLYTVGVTVTNGTHSASATYAVTVADYVCYVSPEGTSEAPFDTWAKAATNIQDAVDAVALAGGRVVVTNGVYGIGGRVAGGQTVTNRLVLDKAVRVESVNGPAATAIAGRWNSAGTPLGALAIRCVYIGAEAVFSGFTVSNGATASAASGNSGRGGGLFLVAGGVATNCVVSDCRGWSGGGVASEPDRKGAVRGCTLTRNAALPVSINSGRGGGAADLTLSGCTVLTNTAFDGGGVYACEANGCELRGNAATSGGGGAFLGTLNRCLIFGNTGTGLGGGAYDAALYSCVLSGNTAYQGGGVFGATAEKGLFNCTVAGNTATAPYPAIGGGGFYGSTFNYPVRNSIIYYNTAAVNSNVYAGIYTYACTAPLQGGEGNIAAPPLLASFERPVLLPGSSCIDAGQAEAWMEGTLDFEGDPRTVGTTVDIGADETQAAAYDDPLSVTIDGPASPYFPLTNYTFTAVVGGHPSYVRWDLGDGQEAANVAQVTHAWPEGEYTLRLTVSNATHSAEATLFLNVAPDTRYVSLTGSHTPPFRTWPTAATNLQAAADVVPAGGRIKVAAGVYDRGGRPASGQTLTNRLYVSGAVEVIAVDGPEVTFIVGAASGAAFTNGLGAGAVRGVYLSSGASLSGFTVTNGHTLWSATVIGIDYVGGGVLCYDETCVIRGCVVSDSAASAYGGGVYQGVVRDSTVERNAACGTGSGSGKGGGVFAPTLLSNCVVRANTSYGVGGGVYAYRGVAVDCVIDGNTVTGVGGGGGFYGDYFPNDVLRNCTVANNRAPGSGGGVYGALLYDCLLTNNVAGQNGGGFAGSSSALSYRCRFIGNLAALSGGGAYYGRYYRCRLVGNAAGTYGGGVYSGTLYSSVISGNSAGLNGGGSRDGTLEACTVLGNTAAYGGGTSQGEAYSCLIYYNVASGSGDNWSGTAIWQCCTVPAYGNDDVVEAPQVSGFYDAHLLPGSPCIDKGLNLPLWMYGPEGLDLDGELRIAGARTDLGADERDEAALDGPLSVGASVDLATFGLMYAPEFRAEATGKVGGLIWDFGDGTCVTNQNPLRHAFSGVGDYTVRVTVSNLTGSATAEVAVTVVLGYVYVDLNGGHAAPFGSWADAATNIQDAVDAAIWGGTVWVTNGTYALGGRADTSGAWLSRVCAEQPVVLRSVNGAAETVIQGAWHDAGTAWGPNAVRGVFLGHAQSRLEGFTVAGGATDTDYTGDGGGVYCAAPGARVSGCVITNCMAYDEGGGAWGGAWENCQLLDNWADWGGGAASQCSLSNCVIAGNSGYSYGGGVYEGALTDCRLTANATYGDGGGASGGALERCEVSGNTAGGSGGGASYSSLTDSVLEGNRAGGSGGGASDCWGAGCSFIGNTAAGDGGGAYWGYYAESRFEGNASESGSGGGYATDSSYDWLNACTVVNNTAALSGGGCYGGSLFDCLLTNNVAGQNGGGYYVPLIDALGELYRCRVRDNRAEVDGGGVYGGLLYSSVVAGNAAGQIGGGTYGSTLESCSVLGNTAGLGAGGCLAGAAYNSIIYHNRAVWAPDLSDTVCENCCTPDVGTVTAPPQVAGFREPHLLPVSPCVDAGAERGWLLAYGAEDMDRDARILGAATDIGADEAVPGTPGGPLAVEVFAVPLSVMPGTAQEFLAEISGLPSGLVWDFGDGTGATNQNPVSHTFASVGTYTVRVTVSNDTYSAFAEIQIDVVSGDVFVSLGGTHEPPFATWETAATNIQDAVDAAPWGGTVYIADGTYELGGRPAAGLALTNRVCIEKPVTVRSLNGPSGVIVRGAWDSPGWAYGAGAVRGVYLGHPDARLTGVTVEGGATSDTSETDGGGVYCAFDETVASNCVVTASTAAGSGGGVRGGTWRACQISGNTASQDGGGCYGGFLYDCLLTNNAALRSGGGYCVPRREAFGELYRCRVWDNRASGNGGGVHGGTLYSCVLSGNVAAQSGGGTYGSTLESCSVLGNTATWDGGGCYEGLAYNSILYYNRASWGENVADTVCENCCTPDFGTVTDPPQVVGFREPHLLPGSPCIDAGADREWMTEDEGLDMDREPRIAGAAADIGAAETVAGTPAGPLAVEVFAETLSVTANRVQAFRAEISGPVSGLLWDFGDGTAVDNQNPVSHAFASVGVYTVRATVFNDTHSAFAEVQVEVISGDVFVTLGGTHEPPFATWETAATNIQDAVDAAPWGGTVYLADGTYELGGRPAAGLALANRVCIEKPVTVQGFNGPSGVIVRGAWHAPESACGAGAVRGVYLGHPEARLVGVTVEGGATGFTSEIDGGGVYCLFYESVVSNCVVTACTAASTGGGASGGSWFASQLSGNMAEYGGGVYGALLTGCDLNGNTANWYGGGLYYCHAVRCTVDGNTALGQSGGGAFGGSLVSCLLTWNWGLQAGGAAYADLDNCTVSANTAYEAAGGVAWCDVANSIVWDNVAPLATNALDTTFDHSATWPLPEGGYDLGGNLDADPQFVNSGVGNYRLAGTSPCVNAGTNLPWIVGETDLDGSARFVGVIVDMGAYEYVTVQSVAALGTPITWLDYYLLGPDWDAAELDDPDHDGFPTWKEYIALTNPTNGASFFAIRDVTHTVSQVTVSFDTALGRVYTLQHTALLTPPAWSNAAAPVAGSGERETVPASEAGPASFFRVGVALP